MCWGEKAGHKRREGGEICAKGRVLCIIDDLCKTIGSVDKRDLRTRLTTSLPGNPTAPGTDTMRSWESSLGLRSEVILQDQKGTHRLRLTLEK